MDDFLGEPGSARWKRICALFEHDRDRAMLRSMMDRGEATANQLVEDSRTKYGGILSLRPGTVYSKLTRMEAAKIIARVRSDRSGLQGAASNYYAVTDLGREALLQYDAATAWIRGPIEATLPP